MDKVLSVNQKRANKHQKSKKKQPLKVVYITNPIKFKASASEFRALVQEFTGQDADTPETARPAVAEGGSGGANAADGLSYVHAEIGQSASSGEAQAVMQNGSDPSSFGSTRDDCDDDDVFSNLWNEAAHLDLLKSLGAM